MAAKKLVIVGGGYIGIELAKALKTEMDVTLVEPNEVFVHAPAMIRAVVDPNLLNRALIPYDKLLSKDKLIRGRATSVDKHGVDLAGGERLNADYIVIATGSSNGVAFKPTANGIEALKEASAELHNQIKAAKHIAIVGAGAVGTELAGEIAATMRGKTVTLISSDDTLFPTMPKKLGRSLANTLKAMGVTVTFGRRVTDLQNLTRPSKGPITLSDGQAIAADLVIPAVGSKPNTELLRSLPGAKQGTAGRVAVDRYLRPSDTPNVFAAGDVADAGDGMTIVGASRQQPWLAKTLRSLAAGKSINQIKPYRPWTSPPILLPLGPQRGSSFLVVGTFGDWITSKAKGKELFIPKYRKILGQD